MASAKRRCGAAAVSSARFRAPYSRPHFMPQPARRPSTLATVSRQRLAHRAQASWESWMPSLSHRKAESSPRAAGKASRASRAAPKAPVRWQKGDTWMRRPRRCSKAATSAGLRPVAPWNTMCSPRGLRPTTLDR